MAVCPKCGGRAISRGNQVHCKDCGRYTRKKSEIIDGPEGQYIREVPVDVFHKEQLDKLDAMSFPNLGVPLKGPRPIDTLCSQGTTEYSKIADKIVNKPSSKVKRIVAMFDCHLTTSSSRPFDLVVESFLPDYKPDEVVLGGDFMSCESLSHWNDNKRLSMESKRWADELSFADEKLRLIQKSTDKITWLKGNHEDWVEQYVEQYPQLKNKIELENNLSFDTYNVDFVPLNELYCIGKNAKLYITHGMYTGLYHAKKHLDSLGCNIMYGHLHTTQTFMHNIRMHDPYQAWAVGCLCDMNQPYLKGKQPNWIHQVAIIEYTDDLFNVQLINIINNSFIFNGKVYK
jgi:predicted phosphodiesterase